jgi:serine/threonine-protein kinase
MVTVPSVGGLSPADAANQLRTVGLNPVVGPQVDSAYPYGTVAFLSPGSGTQIASGSTVTIYVSNGNSGFDDDDDDDEDNRGPGNNNGNGRGRGNR